MAEAGPPAWWLGLGLEAFDDVGRAHAVELRRKHWAAMKPHLRRLIREAKPIPSAGATATC